MKKRFPAPLNGWRAFAGEVGTIVLGVLLALGAQELVQNLHWKGEVRQTRKALDAELGRNLGAFNYRYNQRECVAARTAELTRWAQSIRQGSPLALKRPILAPPWFVIRTAVWEVTDGEIAARMPLERKVGYSAFYDALQRFGEMQYAEEEAWETLAEYQSSDQLAAPELRAVDRAITEITRFEIAVAIFKSNMDRLAGELEIKPDTETELNAHPIMANRRKELCQPLL